MNFEKNQGKKQFTTGLIFFIVIWFAGLLPLDKFFMLFFNQYNAEVLRDTVIQYAGAGLILIVGFKLKFKTHMGLGKPVPAKSWLFIWPLIIMSILNIPETFNTRLFHPEIFLTATPYTRLFFAFSAGIVEELLGRSLIASGLILMLAHKKGGLYLAAFISSLIFGAAHIGNYFVLQYTILANLSQILTALFFGIFFFALFIRTRSIWPGVIMHALVDLCARLDIYSGISNIVPPSRIIFTQTPIEFLVSMAVTIPLAIIGLIMLRKIKPESVFPIPQKIAT